MFCSRSLLPSCAKPVYSWLRDGDSMVNQWWMDGPMDGPKISGQVPSDFSENAPSAGASYSLVIAFRKNSFSFQSMQKWIEDSFQGRNSLVSVEDQFHSPLSRMSETAKESSAMKASSSWVDSSWHMKNSVNIPLATATRWIPRVERRCEAAHLDHLPGWQSLDSTENHSEAARSRNWRKVLRHRPLHLLTFLQPSGKEFLGQDGSGAQIFCAVLVDTRQSETTRQESARLGDKAVVTNLRENPFQKSAIH